MRGFLKMMHLTNDFFRAWTYVRHRVTANNTMGYGIHSPHLFYLARFVIPSREAYYAFSPIERLRSALLRSTEMVYVEDYGTGASGERRVADIARSSLKPRDEAQLLMRLAVAHRAEEMLELGTSLGISSAYLASVGSRAHLTTFEGAPALIEIAKHQWEMLGLKNIDCIAGNIDTTLPQWRPSRPLDLVYIDANHRGEALLRYFEQTLQMAADSALYILDDIHSSPDMEEAWRSICRHPKVTASIDLYSMGLVFLDTNLEKRTYSIRLK